MAEGPDETRDLVLLHPGREAPVDAAAVRARVGQGASVVAIQVPAVQPDGGLDRDGIVGCHHACGVDLARIGGGLRLRDIVLLRLPGDRDGRSRMALLHVWNTPTSHYDIEAVRIPWDQLPGKRDYRNNPRGKNPTNVWAFSAVLEGPPGLSRPGPGPVTSLGIEAEALQRLVRCHAAPGATVHVAAADRDEAVVEAVVRAEGRRFEPLPAGTPDPVQPIPLDVEVPPVAAAAGEPIEHRVVDPESGQVRCMARARFMDCREGLRAVSGVTHAVTSPPYNIGYDPFNVEVRDQHTGRLRAPSRKGYADDLSPAQYAGLLREVFSALDRAADPDGFELFLDIKNDYGKGQCRPPFYMVRLMPERWQLLDLLVWRYDISFDPARRKYKPVYEWVIRVGFGDVAAPAQPMADWYIPILRGNSRERRELAHPAMFPRQVVHRSLQASGRAPKRVVDPFLGSGTTLAACAELGVDALGFEVRGAYRDDVVRRLGWVGDDVKS